MQTIRRWLSYGKASGIMRNMILEGSHDPTVLDLAADLVADLSPINYAAQAQACWAYVRNRIQYLEDPRNDDVFQTPAVTLTRRAGDCDDQVILLASLLRSIGFQVRVVFVFRNKPQNYEADFPEHVYVQVNIDHSGTEDWWVDAETIPTPDDSGGFHMALWGEHVQAGWREIMPIEKNIRGTL